MNLIHFDDMHIDALGTYIRRAKNKIKNGQFFQMQMKPWSNTMKNPIIYTIEQANQKHFNETSNNQVHKKDRYK